MKKFTLFLDESGKSSLASEQAEPFILTGLIIEKRDINTIEGFFRYIKRKYSINTNSPFHSYDIFEHPFEKKLPDYKLKKLSNDLCDFIEIIPIKILILQIDKKLFKSALGIKSLDDFKKNSSTKKMHEFPYRILFTYQLRWFAETLATKEGSWGEIITDSRRGSDKNLIDALEQAKQPESILDPKIKKIIKDRCTGIRFVNKSYLSGALELTDFISYVSFFRTRQLLKTVKAIGLMNVWRKIKNKLPKRKISKITKKEIQSFFLVGKDGVHKYLK